MYDNNQGGTMPAFVNFFLELFMIKQTNKSIGLAQFKKNKASNRPRANTSLKSKDVKLSDLMRRAG